MHIFGETSDVDLVWLVPDDWLRQLFQDNFWEQVVPRLGAEALKVPKLLGMLQVVELCSCRSVMDENVRYRRDSRGEVLSVDVTVNPDCLAGQMDRFHPNYPDFADVDAEAVTPVGYRMYHDGTLLASEGFDQIDRLLCLECMPFFAEGRE